MNGIIIRDTYHIWIAIHSCNKYLPTICEILDKPYGFCCPVAYGKESIILERDYEFRSLREILFSLGEKKDLLTGRWNLSTALGNRSDLQMLSLTALRRGNVFFCFVLFNKRLQSSNVK